MDMGIRVKVYGAGMAGKNSLPVAQSVLSPADHTSASGANVYYETFEQQR